jgi:hypothetical protein
MSKGGDEMPYKMSKQGKKWCVSNSETGESKGCSDSRGKAVGHMRALYSNEKKEVKEIDSLVETALKELGEEYTEKDYYGEPYYQSYTFATSYAELEESRDAIEREMEVNSLISEFPQLARNVMISSEIEDKETAIVALANELAGLISSAPGSEDAESKSLKDDVAIGSGKTIKNIIIDGVKDALAFFGIKPKEKEAETSDDVMLWKETDGSWRWIVRYSNSFRDRDNPPEIISSNSHRRFVELVDKGLAPLPDLQLWHVKGLTIGKATYVAYDEVEPGAGFAVAAGYFLPGTEQVAEWLSNRKDLACSHGMPVPTVKRDESDPTIIIEHETREISLLPQWAAANALTGFVAFKEADMAIPAEKKSKLLDWGVPSEQIDAVEKLNTADAGKALESGVENKEIETPPTDEAQPPVESKEEPVAEATGETTQESPITRAEVVEAMQAIVSAVETINAKIGEIGKELSEIKAAKEKERQDILKDTPPASLLSMLLGGASAIGNPSAEVDKNSELANSKPKEVDRTAEGPTAIPFLNRMIVNQ